mgnify:CR=1 FL=1
MQDEDFVKWVKKKVGTIDDDISKENYEIYKTTLEFLSFAKKRLGKDFKKGAFEPFLFATIVSLTDSTDEALEILNNLKKNIIEVETEFNKEKDNEIQST